MTEYLTEKQKMLAGALYLANDPELVAERKWAKGLCFRYNQSPVELDQRVLRELFGAETDVYLEPPFFCDYGYNFKLGRGVYANHNFVVLDCAPVTLGDDVFIGPNVVLSAAGHPVDPVPRRGGLEFARPIRIGSGVWIGANVSILPGVEIGENTTIGAGSVVTRSMPRNCVAFGNPCRVRKSLT
jgi:maltose O-acetyltransferase